MSYAIAEVVYGAPVTNAILQKIAEEVKVEEIPEDFLRELTGDDDLEGVTMDVVYECLEESVELFETRYTGSGDETPRFIGVVLSTFDETANVKLLDLKLEPTTDQIVEAKAKLDKLPKVLRDHIPLFEVYIIWHTS